MCLRNRQEDHALVLMTYKYMEDFPKKENFMNRKRQILTDGFRIEYPPNWFNNESTAVQSVKLLEDEEVIWTYSYNENGIRYVSGFKIIRK